MQSHTSGAASPGIRIGVDLGGTKIEGIVLDADGNIAERQRTPTPRDDYEATVRAIADLAASLAAPDDAPIGIGTPGAVSLLSGLMKNCNSTCLNGKPLTEDLAAATGRKVRIANDADCFTLSEASDGAAAGARSVFGVILGTGVGGGICIDGQLLQGVSAICGEWGHNPLALQVFDGTSGPGRRCYCGRADCVEAYLSGPGLARSYLEATGEEKDAPAIVAEAATGNHHAVRLLDQYHHLLAFALSTVINILDPEVIVLGGGMSNMESIYTEVPRYLDRYVFSDQFNNRIVRARHGDSSGVRGAAWLWPVPIGSR